MRDVQLQERKGIANPFYDIGAVAGDAGFRCLVVAKKVGSKSPLVEVR